MLKREEKGREEEQLQLQKRVGSGAETKLQPSFYA